MRLAIVSFLFFTTAVFAQTVQPQPTTPSPQTLTVTLPVQQWIGIVRSLQNSAVISAREAGEDVAEINRQYDATQPKQQKK